MFTCLRTLLGLLTYRPSLKRVKRCCLGSLESFVTVPDLQCSLCTNLWFLIDNHIMVNNPTNPSEVWYVSDVGHNVQIFFCTSFLVTEYVNSTTVLSEATHPEQGRTNQNIRIYRLNLQYIRHTICSRSYSSLLYFEQW